MKNIRLIFAILALFIASAGVFATQLVADTFYSNDDCSTSVSQPCTVGTASNCTIGGTQYYYKVNGTGNCLLLKKP